MIVINAVQIINILGTNSIPIKILAEDADIYFAKTIFKTHPPLEDIINELIGNFIYSSWGIQVPEINIIKIENDILQRFIAENNLVSKYSDYNIEDLFVIGFKEIVNHTDVDLHNLTITNKNDFNKFSDPYRFINIAFCDVWLGNKDRRINNTNLLLIEEYGKLDFVAIDHTQLFANQSNYKGLAIHVMDNDLSNMLITSDFTKKICKFAENEIISTYNSRILEKIGTTLDILPNYLENLPSEIGLSKAGKKKIIDVLENQERNNRVANKLINY